MYDKVYTHDGKFVSYMGPYRAQNTITMNVRMTDMADPNYYPSQHEVTVKGPETRNSEAAVRLNSHDSAGIKAHVQTEFGKGPNALLEWVAAAAKIEAANPGISTQELYKQTDVAVKELGMRFSKRSISNPAWLKQYPSTSIEYKDQSYYSPEMQRTIKEYMGAVDPGLVQLASDFLEGNEVRPYALKPVSEELAEDISELIGWSPKGFKSEIEPRILPHLYDHGLGGYATKKNSDMSMRDINDFARIQYVIDNYDRIDFGGRSDAFSEPHPFLNKSRLAKTVVLSKNVDSTFFVVEAVPNSKKGRLNLYLLI